jgi:hypothetical protein
MRWISIGLLIFLASCTPVEKIVSNNISQEDLATAQSSNHATLLDTNGALSATNPNSQSYASLNSGGVYTLQSSQFGSAAIGSQGAFVADPKNTAFEQLTMRFKVFENGTSIPEEVTVIGFNSNISEVISAQVALAQVEFQKIKEMEQTEREVYIQEIKSKQELYSDILQALIAAAGL